MEPPRTVNKNNNPSMIADPWMVYAQESHWQERVNRLERRLQSSLVTACVDHALAAIPIALQGQLAEARQALWEMAPDPKAWLTRLQVYAEQVAESPGPQDPPERAVDALVYAFACLAGEKFDPLEALFSAFWGMAEVVYPSGGWVEELLGRSDLMEELEARIGGCQQAYRELGYQVAVLERLEYSPTPLTRQEAAGLAERVALDETAHIEFARKLYRQALTNLSQATAAVRSYVRVLLYFASFEQEHGQNKQATELYGQALAELQPLGNTKAIVEVRARLKRLNQDLSP